MEPEDVTFQFLREITDDFSEERKIGEGSFGVVYKGVTRNGEDVAVKKLKLCDMNINDKQFQAELNNLRKLEHQNIVRILGYCYEIEKIPFNKPDGSQVYLEETHRALCFEYLDNGSLQKHLSDEFIVDEVITVNELYRLEWHTRFKIIKGTCEGLKYIHEELQAPIYHLDLKPDNILLDKDMVPKIADFGLSRIFDTEPTRTTLNPYGTFGYQPPEYIDRCEISGKFDIFSLGVIMIRIVSGSKGYPKCLDMPSDEFIDQVRNNWRNRLQAACTSNSSLEVYCHQIVTCTQIALKCVEKDSQRRPNISTIIEKLNEIETNIGKNVEPEDITVLTMHDLVHDLARSVMVDGVLDVGKQGDTGGNRSVSVLLSDSTKSLQSFTQYPSKISAMRAVECKKIVLYGASTSSHEYLPFLLCGQIGIHEDVFSFAEYLRVLDLSEYSIQELPSSIGDLKQLRYLSFPRVQRQATANYITNLSKLIYLSLCGSSNILALSESIGEMEGLMYLDLSSCSRIEKLPQSFGKLKELVHLDLSKCSQVTNISESLERLTKLEYLNLSYCSNIGDLPKHLGGLLKLRNLDLSYSSYIDGRANVETLVTLTKLECLNLASHLSFMEILPEALRRLNNLKYLNLSCVDRDSLDFGEQIRFRNLKNLPDCKGVHGILEVLGSLTKLQYLNLSGFSCYVGAKAHLAEMSEPRVKIGDIGNLNGEAREMFGTFLECISKLPNIEHLDLSCNDPYIMYLPNCFGSLGKLHTLNLSGCRDLIELPANLYDMDSLRFLDLTGCLNVRMPKQPGLNKSLLTLPHFAVQADFHGSSSNLFMLQDVNRTDLMISRLDNVKSAQEARNINLKEKSRMEKMELNWTKDVERSVDDMEVLGELVPPTTLEVLKIDGYSSVIFPEWFVGSIAFHLPNLFSISISDLPKCNSLPPLGQLPNLKSLNLERMNGISEINWDLCGSRQAFPRLESFTISKMESVKVWYTTYPGGRDGENEFMFPTLSNLEINDCPKLRLEPCPHGASHLWRIEGRNDGVISSWEEGGSWTSSPIITDLLVSRCNIPMHQWRLLHHLPGLTTLSINECSDLSSSPEIIQALSSVRMMQLGMETLWSELELPNWLGQLASLEDLTVRCYQVKAPHDGFPHLNRLPSLCLFEFGSMTTVQQWVKSLVSLQRLEILDCENLNDLAESFGYLSSLNELRISVCHRIESLPDSIGRLTFLKRLRIDYCKCITSLPESIGALTSLDKLKIMNCDDITSLPESICGLISLNKLIILHCPGITSLPESIQQLTNLRKLQISAYGELEKWCKTEENKKKLAHIKEKTINMLPF